MYIMGENPAMSDPDVAHARAALAKLDHLVVQDLFLTETAALADVILPASAWPEKDGTVTNTNRQVQMGRAAVPLPAGCGRISTSSSNSPAGSACLGLRASARRLPGDGGRRRPRWPTSPGTGWSARAASPIPAHAGRAGRGDRLRRPLPDREGRARFVTAGLRDPDEMPDERYPLMLTTGRQLEHWHTGSMTRRAGMLDALEPEPTASLAPAELARLGLAPGQRLRLRPGAARSSWRRAPTRHCRRGWSSSPSPIARRRRTC